MEAILHLCEKNDIEPEDVKKFISPIIKDKVEAEAMNQTIEDRKTKQVYSEAEAIMVWVDVQESKSQAMPDWFKNLFD